MSAKLIYPVVMAIAVMALVAGCREAKPRESAEPVTPVIVSEVRPSHMVDKLTLLATVEPWTSVLLSAEAPGRLVFVAKEEGQTVGEGERLFGIDTANLEAQLASAKATADYTVQTFERMRQLVETNAASRDQLDKARAERDAALAAVQTARVQLEQADVISPIAGTLDEKIADVGEYMATGSPLGEVVDTSRVKVVASVPEKDIGYVSEGDRLRVVFDALGFAERTGQVIYVGQVAESRTLTFPVHLEVDNAEGRIRPGMIARVELVREDDSAAIAVPMFALMRRTGGYYVYVADDGVARRRDVTFDIIQGDRVRITEGLAPGDRLIVRGQRDLIEGERIQMADVDRLPPELVPDTLAEADDSAGADAR